MVTVPVHSTAARSFIGNTLLRIEPNRRLASAIEYSSSMSSTSSSQIPDGRSASTLNPAPAASRLRAPTAAPDSQMTMYLLLARVGRSLGKSFNSSALSRSSVRMVSMCTPMSRSARPMINQTGRCR
jgi:hypothetical protein